MPKIFLKPNSPEFADESDKKNYHICDMMGCQDRAEHKAPKNRGLNEYHHFCFEHVKEYNKAWNFFSGMSDNEVHDHMMSSMYGDRPTWRYDNDANATDNLRRAAWNARQFTGAHDAFEQKHEQRRTPIQHNTPEAEAMRIMGLEPPVQFTEIKTRYKTLAKEHHPDLNQGCLESEERLKEVNMAYTILKVAYEEFEKLPDREK